MEFPRELEGYYARTADRIPESRRFDTFVVLEIAVRSSRLLTIKKFMGALQGASCESFEQCTACLYNQSRDPNFLETARCHLREYGGGLLEVFRLRRVLGRKTHASNSQRFHWYTWLHASSTWSRSKQWKLFPRQILHNTSNGNGSTSEPPTCSWPDPKPSYGNRASWHVPRPIVRVHYWNKPGKILR